jgi:hypothetical protein
VPDPTGSGGALAIVLSLVARRSRRKSRLIPRTVPWPSPSNAAGAAPPTVPFRLPA